MPADIPWLPFLLQTADALFPTGAYAHSVGFEEIVRLGVVADEESLGRYLRLHVIPALQEQELPYLRFAIHAAEGENIAELCELDHEISAWKPAKETREASVQLGVRRLRALAVISDHSLVRLFEERISAADAQGHHLVVCGIQAAIACVPMQAALHAYSYQSLAAVCSAALKLIRIGQDGCQRALRGASTQAAEAVQHSLRVDRGDAGWFNSVLEIASMRHERADERLFIS